MVNNYNPRFTDEVSFYKEETTINESNLRQRSDWDRIMSGTFEKTSHCSENFDRLISLDERPIKYQEYESVCKEYIRRFEVCPSEITLKSLEEHFRGLDIMKHLYRTWYCLEFLYQSEIEDKENFFIYSQSEIILGTLSGPSFTSRLKKERHYGLMLKSGIDSSIDKKILGSFTKTKGYDSIPHPVLMIHWDEELETDDFLYSIKDLSELDSEFNSYSDEPDPEFYKEFVAHCKALVVNSLPEIISQKDFEVTEKNTRCAIFNGRSHKKEDRLRCSRKDVFTSFVKPESIWKKVRTLVKIEPGNIRDTIVNEPEGTNTVGRLSHHMRSILEKCEYSSMSSVSEHYRRAQILKSNYHFIYEMYDIKKSGLTHPLWTVKAFKEALLEIKKESSQWNESTIRTVLFDSKKEFCGDCFLKRIDDWISTVLLDLEIYFKQEVFLNKEQLPEDLFKALCSEGLITSSDDNPSFYPKRGFGLGQCNEFVTLCQCIWYMIRKGIDLSVSKGLFWNDDAVVTRLNFYSDLESGDAEKFIDDTFKSLKYVNHMACNPLSLTKSFIGYGTVFCEDYSFHDYDSTKRSLASQALFSVFNSRKICEAKFRFNSLMKSFPKSLDSFSNNIFKTYVLPKFGYEFHERETSLPFSFGGWVTPIINGLDYSYVFFEELGLEEKYQVASTFPLPEFDFGEFKGTLFSTKNVTKKKIEFDLPLGSKSRAHAEKQKQSSKRRYVPLRMMARHLEKSFDLLHKSRLKQYSDLVCDDISDRVMNRFYEFFNSPDSIHSYALPLFLVESVSHYVDNEAMNLLDCKTRYQAAPNIDAVESIKLGRLFDFESIPNKIMGFKASTALKTLIMKTDERLAQICGNMELGLMDFIQRTKCIPTRLNKKIEHYWKDVHLYLKNEGKMGLTDKSSKIAIGDFIYQTDEYMVFPCPTEDLVNLFKENSSVDYPNCEPGESLLSYYERTGLPSNLKNIPKHNIETFQRTGKRFRGNSLCSYCQDQEHLMPAVFGPQIKRHETTPCNISVFISPNTEITENQKIALSDGSFVESYFSSHKMCLRGHHHLADNRSRYSKRLTTPKSMLTYIRYGYTAIIPDQEDSDLDSENGVDLDDTSFKGSQLVYNPISYDLGQDESSKFPSYKRGKIGEENLGPYQITVEEKESSNSEPENETVSDQEVSDMFGPEWMAERVRIFNSTREEREESAKKIRSEIASQNRTLMDSLIEQNTDEREEDLPPVPESEEEEEYNLDLMSSHDSESEFDPEVFDTAAGTRNTGDGSIGTDPNQMVLNAVSTNFAFNNDQSLTHPRDGLDFG